MPTTSDGRFANSPRAAAGAGHPAPARGHVTPRALWFGLFGAPAAWSVQTLVDLPLVAHSCFPRLYPLRSPLLGGLRGIAFVVGLAAVAVCVAATAVAWQSWRRTRGEHQEGSGRGREHAPSSALLETGEGRTRFMALSGVLAGVTFLIASVAQTATILLVGPCWA